jgi:hypothetical protein
MERQNGNSSIFQCEISKIEYMSEIRSEIQDEEMPFL